MRYLEPDLGSGLSLALPGRQAARLGRGGGPVGLKAVGSGLPIGLAYRLPLVGSRGQAFFQSSRAHRWHAIGEPGVTTVDRKKGGLWEKGRVWVEYSSVASPFILRL